MIIRVFYEVLLFDLSIRVESPSVRFSTKRRFWLRNLRGIKTAGGEGETGEHGPVVCCIHARRAFTALRLHFNEALFCDVNDYETGMQDCIAIGPFLWS